MEEEKRGENEEKMRRGYDRRGQSEKEKMS